MSPHAWFIIVCVGAMLGGEAWRRIRLRRAQDISANRVIEDERQRKARGKVF
jgi:hypothetical protein